MDNVRRICILINLLGLPSPGRWRRNESIQIRSPCTPGSKALVQRSALYRPWVANWTISFTRPKSTCKYSPRRFFLSPQQPAPPCYSACLVRVPRFCHNMRMLYPVVWYGTTSKTQSHGASHRTFRCHYIISGGAGAVVKISTAQSLRSPVRFWAWSKVEYLGDLLSR